MIYFISDCSLDYENISLVTKHWNSAVKRGDIVYHIGDFTEFTFEFAAQAINRLNGEIHFLPGSSDYWMEGISKKLISKVKSATGQHCFFEPEITSVQTGYKRESTKMPIVLCHYPMTMWQGSYDGSLHAFGHCHGKLMMRAPRSIDVSYNIFNKPVDINFIIRWLKERNEV